MFNYLQQTKPDLTIYRSPRYQFIRRSKEGLYFFEKVDLKRNIFFWLKSSVKSKKALSVYLKEVNVRKKKSFKERLITILNMHLKKQTKFHENVSVLELVVRHLNHPGNGFQLTAQYILYLNVTGVFLVNMQTVVSE